MSDAKIYDWSEHSDRFVNKDSGEMLRPGYQNPERGRWERSLFGGVIGAGLFFSAAIVYFLIDGAVALIGWGWLAVLMIGAGVVRGAASDE